MDTHFLPNLLNCYDESALELALRVAEDETRHALPLELTALTAGGEASELYLKTLRALGYAHTVRASADEGELRFVPHRIARTIANYAQEHPQSLILLGQEAPVGNTGSIPQMVSAMTGYPLVCSVIDILALDEGSAVVQVSDLGRVLSQRVTLPCVFAIGNAVVSKLRVPTLRARMQTKQEVCACTALALEETPVHLAPVQLALPERRRAGYLSPETGDKAVQDILEKSLRERLELL